MSTGMLVTVSRPECVNLVKENIAKFKGQVDDVLVMVDHPEIGDDFDGRVVHMERDKPPHTDWRGRRTRIADVLNEARNHLPYTPYTFGFEDDSVLPDDALKRLWEFADMKLGIVSGVQVGRWGTRYWGAWYADDWQYPTEISSVDPGKKISGVDATGLYCYLTQTINFRNAHFGVTDGYGPDIGYGLRMTGQGFRNKVDRDLHVGHWTPRGIIEPSLDDPQITIKKTATGWATLRT